MLSNHQKNTSWNIIQKTNDRGLIALYNFPYQLLNAESTAEGRKNTVDSSIDANTNTTIVSVLIAGGFR
jgi:hypothetical protein